MLPPRFHHRPSSSEASSSDEDEQDSYNSDHPDNIPPPCDSEAATLAELRSTIKSLPLGQVERLHQTGINGVPLAKALRPSAPNVSAVAPAAHSPSDSQRGFSKNAPKERSSKIQVSRNRAVVDVKKKSSHDPRFSRSEPVNLEQFRRHYAFLETKATEEVTSIRKIMEREQLGRQLGGRAGRRKRKLSDQELVELQRHLTRTEQFQAESRRASQTRRALADYKKTHSGQLFVSHGTKKRLALDERFDDLQARGRLDQFLSKKRRRVQKETSAPPLGV